MSVEELAGLVVAAGPPLVQSCGHLRIGRRDAVIIRVNGRAQREDLEEMSAQPAAPVERFGGTRGNEAMTVTTAVVLTVLLVAEGVTVIHMRGLRSAHMFIGMALIPPLFLKLGSVGYRFARYYLGSPTYRAKGPPQIVLRSLAPVLVLTTIGIFVTGIVLMADGRKAGTVLEIHKVSFIVWSVMFGIHFLAYVPHVLRTLPAAWTSPSRPGGANIRALLTAAAAGGGVALALALLPTIRAWHP